ncbi:MAG: M42 family metallopeptidase [Peptococcaceae bacterium]|nr:M42 family metallopeptidase [Peptococcaceae bacterium]
MFTSILDLQYITTQVLALCQIPSPSGNVGQAMTYLAGELDKLGVTHAFGSKGTLLASLPGVDSSVHRTVTAHVDTLGAMVKEIKSNGRLVLTQIGGYNWQSVEGELCLVETMGGQTYTGTLLNTHASAHVFADHAQQERKAENMELRLDERAADAEAVRSLGIEVGDFVSFAAGTRLTSSGFINSRHLDDKASVAILLGVIKAIQRNELTLPYQVNFIFSNNEELGYGGNSSITPQTKEYLAVDMGAIGEGQATDEFCVSICAKDSSGPYNYELRKRLVNLAQAHGIYYRIDTYPHYGSDAGAALRAGHDIMHGLIGPGIDASHSHERTHQEALDNTARLLMYYLLAN